MYRQKALLLATVTLATAGAAIARTSDPQIGLRSNDPTLRAFTHARVVSEPGVVVEDATLVVRDGRIVAITAAGAVPAGADEIDLSGKTVYPGFVDPYTEYGLPVETPAAPGAGPQGPTYFSERSGADSWNDAVHPEIDWVESFKPDAEAAKAFLGRGVTAVQSVRKDGIFRGRGFTASLAGELANEALLASHTRHFASFDRGSSRQEYPSSLMGSIALVRQTLYDAHWYADAHGAWTPASDEAPPETNRALAALVGNDGPVVFETEDALSLLRAARIGSELDLPMIHVGSGDEYEWLAEVAAAGRTLVLPASLPAEPSVGTYEDSLDVSLAALRRWERAPANAAALAGAGVRLALTAHGLRDDENLWDNVRSMVEHGLPADEALAALTTVPAEVAGVDHLVGTLARGKRADFVVADGDLFVDGSIAATFVGGRLAHEAEPLDGQSLAGTYGLTLAGVEYTLTLSDDPAKAELVAGDDTIEGKNLQADGDRVTLRARLADGVVRLSLFRLGGEVRGQAALADGTLAPVVLTPAAADEEAEEDAEEAAEEERADEAPTYLSSLTRPSGAFGLAEPPRPETVVVRGATVWTGGEAGVLEDADLFVRDGRIVAVGADLTVPAGTREIDAAGKHVTAGMIDEHAHIAIQGGVNEGSHEVTAEVRIGDVVDPTDIDIYRALAGGTTAAQLLHGSANPIGGQAQVIKLRWGRGPEDLKFAAAPPSIKFALGENVKQSNWGDNYTVRYPQTRMGVETVIKDRFLAARDYAAERHAWEALPAGERARTVPPRRDLQLDALVEILDSERFVHCHSYVQSEILMLMRLAEELGFRIQTFTHILEGYKVAPEMAAHGAGGSTFSDWWAYKFEVYDAIPQNTCLMHDAGVVTSINSDSSDLIRRLNSEAGKSVLHCGMDEEAALAMATLNPAKQLKIDHRVGSLEPGKDADFVIWNGHPLSMHTRAEQTWIDGARYFDLETDQRLRQAVRAERRALVQKILEEDPEAEENGGETETAAEGEADPAPEAASSQRRRYHCEDREDYWNARTRP